MKALFSTIVFLLSTAHYVHAQIPAPVARGQGSSSAKEVRGLSNSQTSLLLASYNTTNTLSVYDMKSHYETKLPSMAGNRFRATIQNGRYVISRQDGSSLLMDSMYYDLQTKRSIHLMCDDSNRIYRACPHSIDASNTYIVSYSTTKESPIYTTSKGLWTASIYELATGKKVSSVKTYCPTASTVSVPYAQVVDCSFDFDSHILAQAVLCNNYYPLLSLVTITDFETLQTQEFDICALTGTAYFNAFNVFADHGIVRVIALESSGNKRHVFEFAKEKSHWKVISHNTCSLSSELYYSTVATTYSYDLKTLFNAAAFYNYNYALPNSIEYKIQLVNLLTGSVYRTADTVSKTLQFGSVFFGEHDTCLLYSANSKAEVYMSLLRDSRRTKLYPTGTSSTCAMSFASNGTSTLLSTVDHLGNELDWDVDHLDSVILKQNNYAGNVSFTPGISDYCPLNHLIHDAVSLSDLQSGRARYYAPNGTRLARFSAGGDSVIVASTFGIHVLSSAWYTVLDFMGLDAPVTCMSYNKSTGLIAAGLDNGTVQRVDLARRQTEQFLGPSAAPKCVALSLSGKKVAASDANYLFVWYSGTQRAHVIFNIASIRALAFCEDDRFVLVASDSGVYIVNAETAQVMCHWTNQDSPIVRFEISVDNTWIAALSQDGTIQLWKLNQFSLFSATSAINYSSEHSSASSYGLFTSNGILKLAVPADAGPIFSVVLYDLQGKAHSPFRWHTVDSELQIELGDIPQGWYEVVMKSDRNEYKQALLHQQQ